MKIFDAADDLSEFFVRLFTQKAGPKVPDGTSPWSQDNHDDGCLGMLGHFRVFRILGSGGTGTVLLAEDPTRNRQVALKLLNPELADNPGIRRRFFREARIAMAVHHPHVVETHAVCEVPEGPFIVSEYMAGGSLQDLLDHRGPLAATAICDFGRQIAEGLVAIHGKRLVHSDIKPLNILPDESQLTAKIADFGLARVAAQRGTVRQVFATPQYASPEQLQGFALDSRSDLFSLGSVLYTMCTGRPPFPGTSSVAVTRKVCYGRPRPIETLNPAIPQGVVEVIAKLMMKDRGSRFVSAAQVAAALTSQGLA